MGKCCLHHFTEIGYSPTIRSLTVVWHHLLCLPGCFVWPQWYEHTKLWEESDCDQPDTVTSMTSLKSICGMMHLYKLLSDIWMLFRRTEKFPSMYRWGKLWTRPLNVWCWKRTSVLPLMMSNRILPSLSSQRTSNLWGKRCSSEQMQGSRTSCPAGAQISRLITDRYTNTYTHVCNMNGTTYKSMAQCELHVRQCLAKPLTDPSLISLFWKHQTHWSLQTSAGDLKPSSDRGRLTCVEADNEDGEEDSGAVKQRYNVSTHDCKYISVTAGELQASPRSLNTAVWLNRALIQATLSSQHTTGEAAF